MTSTELNSVVTTINNNDYFAWDLKTARKNPYYVVGSRRKPTNNDLARLGKHCHGKICEIRCCVCGDIRIVNSQDAHQSKKCKTHQ